MATPTCAVPIGATAPSTARVLARRHAFGPPRRHTAAVSARRSPSRACFFLRGPFWRSQVAKRSSAVSEEKGESLDGAGGEDVERTSGSEDLSLELSDATVDDFLHCKDMRHKLTPRESPFVRNNMFGGGFVFDKDRVRLKSVHYSRLDSQGAQCADGIADPEHGTCVPLPPFTTRAGARRTIYFEPAEVQAAIITCGGLCPGLNDVLQNIVYTLTDYGVPEDQIYGIRNGLMGLYDSKAKPIVLDRKTVDGIHLQGGTILGTSRGGAAKIPKMVDRLDLWGINMVFVIGGNGGNAAAHAIQEEVEKRNMKTVVVGVPKSIDNDILLIDRCFGFQTAVDESQRALMAAKVEASSAKFGLGIVKLMGRQSGFIAMNASLASGVVDVCLIPEVPFTMDKLVEHVQSILTSKGHAVLCVAEGAGQDLMESLSHEKDASGNPVLGDIGKHIRSYMKQHLEEADIKYIDPTYMIRAIPTTSQDRIYCKALAQGAVHAAFAGYTDVSVGLVNTHMAILPIPTIIQAPKVVNPGSSTYNRMRQAIRQPDLA
eukprot:CAMPEP_0117680344 /NCGR_PEP_ID=MMETSP0804-20121206/18301_1 /TAXON_ID=1074897 /ORGANISM="Tetraselmis astigmatica, Strain CCMP880" /LENGTH=543 /DNA_ID=CAMNT_0005489833 /DNA_START=86 /DNA_END=1717 /DNA_ORIENTATION=+